jgi:hypothetical protein
MKYTTKITVELPDDTPEVIIDEILNRIDEDLSFVRDRYSITRNNREYMIKVNNNEEWT